MSDEVAHQDVDYVIVEGDHIGAAGYTDRKYSIE
jgi:hypothetical protein